MRLVTWYIKVPISISVTEAGASLRYIHVTEAGIFVETFHD